MNSDRFTGPLFVVGMWRSGTSLLYALLNQHPQISLMYEGELPVLSPLFAGGKGKADWAQRWNFWNGALARHQMEGKLKSEPMDFAAAIESAYRCYAGDKPIWGCKSPNYYDCMTRLAKLFPSARFIVIWRNPLDICRSIAKAGEGPSWFNKRGMLLRGLLGYERMKIEFDRLKRMGARVHELQYEELVRNPQQTMQEVCGFLDVPFDPKMATLRDADRSAIYQGEHHQMVNSERIVSSRERQEALTPEFKHKTSRYIRHWHAKYAGQWPRGLEHVEGEQAGVWERMIDSFRYKLLRTLDGIKVLAFCFAPLSLLRVYRFLKYRNVLPQAYTIARS